MISFFPPEQVPGLPLTPGHFWTLSFSFLINQLKSLLDVLQFCFCFVLVGFFDPEARGISAPRPGI